MGTDPTVSDEGRLLFGAGFVFGVAVTMVIVVLVTATVARRAGRAVLSPEVLLTLGGGIVFAAIVGISLWVLAFPENRLLVPLATLGAPDDGQAPGDGTDEAAAGPGGGETSPASPEAGEPRDAADEA